MNFLGIFCYQRRLPGHAKSQCCQCDNLAEPTRGPRDSSLFNCHSWGQLDILFGKLDRNAWTRTKGEAAYHLSLTNSPSVQGEFSGIKSDQTCAVNSRQEGNHWNYLLFTSKTPNTPTYSTAHCLDPPSLVESNQVVWWGDCIPLRGSNTIESETIGIACLVSASAALPRQNKIWPVQFKMEQGGFKIAWYCHFDLKLSFEKVDWLTYKWPMHIWTLEVAMLRQYFWPVWQLSTRNGHYPARS